MTTPEAKKEKFQFVRIVILPSKYQDTLKISNTRFMKQLPIFFTMMFVASFLRSFSKSGISFSLATATSCACVIQPEIFAQCR
jgi:hypothetical protein